MDKVENKMEIGIVLIFRNPMLLGDVAISRCEVWFPSTWGLGDNTTSASSKVMQNYRRISDAHCRRQNIAEPNLVCS